MRKFCKEISLATLNPQLSKEWDYEKNYPLRPEDVFAHSRKKVWWACKQCQQKYISTIDNRSNGSGCPYCSGRKTCFKNCLAVLRPDLAKEWHPTKNGHLTPFDVVLGASVKINWICKNGHEYLCSVTDRATRNHSCLICNSLGVKNSDLAREWHPTKNGKLTPFRVSNKSGRRAWWICPICMRSYTAKISNKTSSLGCPRCHGVELKDGAICDSVVEAYYYLSLKNKEVPFQHHVNIGLGRCSCDFYIPSMNKYIEVTGFNRTWINWKKYYNGIIRKRKHITQTLRANFEFVKIKLTIGQIQHVRKHIYNI